MTAFKINLTTEEALDFVRMNLSFNADKGLWQFVGGKTIHFDLHQVVLLEDIKSKIFDAYTEAIETHPLNPCIKCF